MPQLKHIFPLALLLLLAVSCEDDAVDPNIDPTNSDIADTNHYTINIDELTQAWTHSYEEDDSTATIFRPSNSMEFPVSRYRQVYNFGTDSTCQYIVLAGNDAHGYQTGTWTYAETSKILSISDKYGDALRQFEIVELTDSIFKITVDDNNYPEIQDWEFDVTVQFDLLDGFADRTVSIQLNGVQSYNANLPLGAPLTGPMDSFTTGLPRGHNQFDATCSGGTSGMMMNHEHSFEFELGDADGYFIALNDDDVMDSLTVVLQISPFIYL